MSPVHLFTISGEYVGFHDGANVWNVHADWIGWFPWGPDVVATPAGHYLGTIEGDRLVRYRHQPRRELPARPARPARPPKQPRQARKPRLPQRPEVEEVPANLISGRPI